MFEQEDEDKIERLKDESYTRDLSRSKAVLGGGLLYSISSLPGVILLDATNQNWSAGVFGLKAAIDILGRQVFVLLYNVTFTSDASSDSF